MNILSQCIKTTTALALVCTVGFSSFAGARTVHDPSNESKEGAATNNKNPKKKGSPGAKDPEVQQFPEIFDVGEFLRRRRHLPAANPGCMSINVKPSPKKLMVTYLRH